MEVLALQVFHDDVRVAVWQLALIQHMSHVVALEPRSDAGLDDEPGQGFLRVVADGIAANELDRDAAAELFVDGRHDHAHAALAKGPLNAEAITD